MSNGTIVDPGAIINVSGTGTMRLDAIWIPSVVTFHYRGNGHTGGTVPTSHSLTTPGTVTLRQPGNMVRAGHTFIGWRCQNNTLSAGGSNITFPVPVVGSVTFDAYWRQNTVTVTYNGNGHTSGAVPAGHTINTPGSFVVRAPGNLARTGYVFDGWRHVDSNNVFWPGDTISLTGAGTMRLDAQWRRVSNVGGNITWLEVSQFHTDIEKFVSSTRLPEFGTHRNVTVAIIMQQGIPGGTAFVLLGETWQYAGQVSVTFGFARNAYIPIEPAFVNPAQINVAINQRTLIAVNQAVNEIRNLAFTNFGIDVNTLSQRDSYLFMQGVVTGLDNNFFFGLAQRISDPGNEDRYRNEQMYWLGRMMADTHALATFGVTAVSVGSTAYRLWVAAKVAATGTAATAWTGVGAIKGGGITVGVSVGALATTAVAVGSGAMAARSGALLAASQAGFTAASGGGGGPKSPSEAARIIINAERTGSALKPDLYHRAPSYLSESQLAQGETFLIVGGDGTPRTLLQVRGELNGRAGVFEFLLEPNGTVSHQLFKPGRIIDGIIN